LTSAITSTPGRAFHLAAERLDERTRQVARRVVAGLDVVVVQPGQLFRVVLRRRLAQVLQIEPFDELFAREDLGVAVRPAQARQIVQHGLGR
jgi:hypothetical protein